MRKTMTGLAMAATLLAAPLAAQDPVGQPADTTGMRMMQPGMMQMMNHPMMMGMMQRMHGQHAGQHGMGMMGGGMMGGGMMGGGMMGGGMMGAGGGPAMILGLEESLELTQDQVERLEALHETAQTNMRQHMMQAMQTMHAAQDLMASPSPDLAAYEARLRDAADHMVLAHTAMAGTGLEARSVLTPEQLERLQLAREMMQEMGQRMQGGAMMPGMMQGPETGGGDTGGHDH